MTSIDRIKSICKEKGISIYTLESALGFSHGYISKIQKRGAMPDDRLKAVADYLKVSVGTLVGEPEPEKLSDDEKDLLKMFRSLPRINKSRVIAFTYDVGHEDEKADKKTVPAAKDA